MRKLINIAAETFVSWSIAVSLAWELLAFLYKHGWF